MTTLTVGSAPKQAWWRNRVVRRFFSHRLAVLGLVMITLLSLACAFAPYLLPYDSLQIDLRARFAPPLTGDHYLGADPIIFIGQDFAFAQGHTHAAGMIYDAAYDEHALGPDQFLVPGANGGQVVTSRTHYDYLLLMQDYVLNINRARKVGERIHAEHKVEHVTVQPEAPPLSSELHPPQKLLRNRRP